MATKADFTEDEWKALQQGVTGSAMLVSLADRADELATEQQRERSVREQAAVGRERVHAPPGLGRA